MIHSIFKLYFKSTKNRVMLFAVLIYSILFFAYIWHSESAYLESEGNLHMNRSRVANTQAMTLSKTRDINPSGYTREEIDRKIDFFSTVSKNELTTGKFLLSQDQKNFKFINLTMNKIYSQYLLAIEENTIPLQAAYDLGYTLDELHALEAYTRYLDGYDKDLVLNPNAVNSANLSMKFFTGSNLIVLTCLIVFSIFDIYLTNMNDGSYKILYTLSTERRKVLFSKVIVSIIVGITMVIVSFCLVNLVAFIVGGAGDWSYPIMSKEFPVTFLFNDMSTLKISQLYSVVIASFVLYLFILISILAFILCISVITDSSSATIGIFLCTIFISVIFHTALSENAMMKLMYPYSYLFSESVWSIKSQLNSWYGLVSNTIIIIVSLILMRIRIMSKDLLGSNETN